MTFFVAAAIGGSALLGAYSSNKAADAQADAAAGATSAQERSAAESLRYQKEAFDKTVELQAPFREAGLTGQNRLMDILGLSGRTGAEGYGSANAQFQAKNFGDQPFTQDPSYMWRLQQGQQALERSASARGGVFSGRAGKDLTNYAQGAASQEYSNAFNRFQGEQTDAFNRFQINRTNTLNPLQSLAGQAQSGANTISSAAQNYGNNAASTTTNLGNNQANNLMAAGNANASGYMGTANAISGGIGQGLNYFQNQNMMNRFFPTSGSNTPVYPG